ncbi:hypothetical protein BS643_22665 [Pseudomonas protegens]|uniref:hypothetical protein n=1 Tax=Pseudomonas protegens TaxID=380021 RepID=UPI0008070473|nr:hypothetical protein [Pseudomonas protegens]OBZ20180.1 hypothetical protein BBH58_28390 [Pseudomonas protegens]OBZ21283.1 hypothetical protein BBH57_28425 [Pseudomonas protegens]OKK40551.1 hypothetical protein BS643_22665 [Pseudomonas protegens]OKK52855.1 hypothetical protein BS644_03200 [Pseudomonas protegens]OKK58347.1 hypothetical protein BS646_24815 [Pseudomonas protegens]
MKRGNVYTAWKAQALPEVSHERILDNGCGVDVRARETPAGDVDLLICVYTAQGQCVAERLTHLPGAEWCLEHALRRGVDQALRIAGGESGRLRNLDPTRDEEL